MFKIYSASAGSGKTYTLVKDYLKIILRSNAYLPQRHLLAITFTNKAVEEMKARILDALMRFSNPKILNSHDSLFIELTQDLALSPQQLHLKASKLIQKILHNYGSFEVSTIDKFNQKLIRTFAHDLEMPMNFEVELYTDFLLQQAVDRLISKAGEDSALTKVLVDYAVSKSDDDKSWDIAIDLNKAAKLLTKETALPFLETLRDKDLKAFTRFDNKLKHQYNALTLQISSTASEILDKISDKGLQYNDFSRGSIPNYFSALASNKMDVKLDAVWQQNITTTSFYTQKKSQQVKAIIEGMRPLITTAFEATKKGLYRLKYLKNIQKNLTPLSVLTLVQKEVNDLKIEQNLVLISEFNSLISKEIKSQPTPFIYERIGEKYAHYFIDEFQDTSEMQWENLSPLIKNALANIEGSVLLVGDAKQAIYRWRGGHPEQFINLINNNTDFPTKAEVLNLPINYRSCKTIVNFNNSFFQHLSNCIFSESTHREIYQNAPQDNSLSKQGYVKISLLAFEKGETKEERYAAEVFKTIENYINSFKNAAYKDICVLVRKRKEGVAVANYLATKNVPIISDQSMLISASKEVKFIINIFKYILNPMDAMIHLQLIDDLIDRHQIAQPHKYRLKQLNLKPTAFFKSLSSLGIDFNVKSVLDRSIYEATEKIISAFGLVKSSDAYVQFFLDFIFEFTHKATSSIPLFLEHYGQHKERLSIVSPKGVQAVQIMTVHKAKGLEFPVVIFPFAALNIYKEIEPKEWMPTHGLSEDFPYFLMNYNKDFEHFGVEGQMRFYEHQSKLELDNINLLYVTLTRAVEQLYIIGEAPTDAASVGSPKTYSELLVNFLKSDQKWRSGILEYSYGSIQRIGDQPPLKHKTQQAKKFFSTSYSDLSISMVNKAAYMWDQSKKEAIEKGNLVHLLLSKIVTHQDIQITIQNFFQQGLISFPQSAELNKVVNQIVYHPELKHFYSNDVEVYNEREIISDKGQIIIPDRLIVQSDGSAVLIDYKTGSQNPSHPKQLKEYGLIVSQMGYLIEKKILVYIYPKIQIKVV